MAQCTKRLWTHEEKRSICFEATTSGVSVAQVTRRYAMNTNMVFKWLRDPRYSPKVEPMVKASATNAACFLTAKSVDQRRKEGVPLAIDPAPSADMIEFDVTGGHRLGIFGGCDPGALARLIRGLSA